MTAKSGGSRGVDSICRSIDRGMGHWMNVGEFTSAVQCTDPTFDRDGLTFKRLVALDLAWKRAHTKPTPQPARCNNSPCDNNGQCYLPLDLNSSNPIGWTEIDSKEGNMKKLVVKTAYFLTGAPSEVGSRLLDGRTSRVQHALAWGVANSTFGSRPQKSLLHAGETESGSALSQSPGGPNLIDSQLGNVIVVPERVGRFTAWLIAERIGGLASIRGLAAELDQIILRRWDFEVIPQPTLEVAVLDERLFGDDASKYVDPRNTSMEFVTGQSYRIAPLKLDLEKTNVSFGKIGDMSFQLRDAPDSFFVNTKSGLMFGVFEEAGEKSFASVVVDKGGESALVEQMNFTVVEPPKFIVATTTSGQRNFRSGASDYTDPTDASIEYETKRPYRFAPLVLNRTATKVSSGAFEDITFSVVGAPNSFFVQTGSGELFGTFEEAGDYRFELQAIDASKASSPVEVSRFNVRRKVDFSISSFKHVAEPAGRLFEFDIDDLVSNDPNSTQKEKYYSVREAPVHSRQLCYAEVAVRLAPIRIVAATGAAGGVTFTADGAPDGFFINTDTGKMLGKPTANQATNTSIYAVDKFGTRASLETIEFVVLPPDISLPQNGPHGKACLHGQPVDGDKFDSKFNCSCAGTSWTGENCEVPNNCRENEIVVVHHNDSGCQPCGMGSQPGEDRLECILRDWTCPASNGVNMGCNCSFDGPTKQTVDITCPGDMHTQATTWKTLLPPQTTTLHLVDVDPNAMADIFESLPATIGHVFVSLQDIPAGNVPEQSSKALDATCMNTASSDIVNCPVTNTNTSMRVGVCFDGACSGSGVTAVVCRPGEYADVERAACRPCDRGGFFASRPGLVGSGSHCGCSLCNNGTYSNTFGAVDPVANCQVCPLGTDTNAKAGYRACRCLEDFSRADRFGPCQSCSAERGVVCEDDIRMLKEGFYWTFGSPERQAQYTAFACNLRKEAQYDRALSAFNGTFPPSYECPTPANCLGGVSSACLEGRAGPLCSVCDVDARHFKLNGDCYKCPSSGASTVMLLLIGAALLTLLGAVLRVNLHNVPKEAERSAHAHLSDSGDDAACSSTAQEPSRLSTMTAIKILIGYIQVQSMITEVYTGVPWPSATKQFGTSLQVASGSMAIMMPSCLSASFQLDAHAEFLTSAVVPLVAVVVIGIVYVAAQHLSTRSRSQLQAECASSIFCVYFLVCPSITVNSIRLLVPCKQICTGNDGDTSTGCTEYLSADYSVACATPKHAAYQGFAGLAFAIYSILLPCAIAAPAVWSKFIATPADSAAAFNKPLLRGVQFYYSPYTEEYMFWETVDLFRKLFVTGIVVFIADGTSLQVTVGIFFALFFFVLQFHYAPYKAATENWLASAALAAISATLILGSLLRSTSAEIEANMPFSPVDTLQLGIILITVAVFMFAFVLYAVVRTKLTNSSHLQSEANLASTVAEEPTVHVNGSGYGEAHTIMNAAFDQAQIAVADSMHDLVLEVNNSQIILPTPPFLQRCKICDKRYVSHSGIEGCWDAKHALEPTIQFKSPFGLFFLFRATDKR